MITKFNKFMNEDKENLLDVLLDKISEEGMESLTKNELNYLNQVSKGKVDKDFEKKLSIRDEHTFICSNRDIPDLQFDYIETEDFGDMIIHKGDIKFDGNEYFGGIFCNSDGSFNRAEFFFYEFSEDASDEEQGEVGSDLYDDAEGLEHELDEFFSDEVCPFLED